MGQLPRPLHPSVTRTLAEQCIARMQTHHKSLRGLDPSQRAQRLVEQATFAEIELCNLVGALAGAQAEQQLRQLFWPSLPSEWTAGAHILDEAIAAAGATR
ncbi:MAG: hypothetical protein EOP37_03330 [Rubrivivax sp.]|nr:MAG: hypothetical protein EOP37_03330 [Rubrivivax sp.]